MATKRKRGGNVTEVLPPYLGEAITRLREAKRYSKAKLAREAGMDAKTLDKLELGTAPMRQDYFEGICRILKIDVADLFMEAAYSLKEAQKKGIDQSRNGSIHDFADSLRKAHENRAQSDRQYLDAWIAFFIRLSEGNEPPS